MARPFRIGATGGPVVRSNPAQSPNSETGRAAVYVPDRSILSSTPEAIKGRQSSGGPRRALSLFGGGLLKPANVRSDLVSQFVNGVCSGLG